MTKKELIIIISVALSLFLGAFSFGVGMVLDKIEVSDNNLELQILLLRKDLEKTDGRGMTTFGEQGKLNARIVALETEMKNHKEGHR